MRKKRVESRYWRNGAEVVVLVVLVVLAVRVVQMW